MSTKYILPSGRDAVHAALLACVLPCLESILSSDTDLDQELRRLKAEAFATPLVDQMVAVLEGNAEGSTAVLLISVLKSAAERRKRLRGSVERVLDEMFAALAEDRKSAAADAQHPKTATETAAEKAPKIDDHEERMTKLMKSLGLDLDTGPLSFQGFDPSKRK